MNQCQHNVSNLHAIEGGLWCRFCGAIFFYDLKSPIDQCVGWRTPIGWHSKPLDTQSIFFTHLNSRDLAKFEKRPFDYSASSGPLQAMEPLLGACIASRPYVLPDALITFGWERVMVTVEKERWLVRECELIAELPIREKEFVTMSTMQCVLHINCYKPNGHKPPCERN